MLSSKHEEIVDYLKHALGLKLILEHHIGNGLRLDIYIPSISVAIEIDGIQHEEFNKFFHKTESEFKFQKIRDKKKVLYCKENNIDLFRVKSYDKRSPKDIMEEIFKQL